MHKPERTTPQLSDIFMAASHMCEACFCMHVFCLCVFVCVCVTPKVMEQVWLVGVWITCTEELTGEKRLTFYGSIHGKKYTHLYISIYKSIVSSYMYIWRKHNYNEIKQGKVIFSLNDLNNLQHSEYLNYYKVHLRVVMRNMVLKILRIEKSC